MAFVPVPRDLTKIKSKVALNLTFRQLVCFGTAVVIGLPTYFLARGAVGNSTAVLVMIGVMLPAFFIAMYEKDGQPAEKILRNVLRLRWFYPSKRPYRTENFYHILEKEALFEKQAQKAGTASKTPAAKSTAVKRKHDPSKLSAEKPAKKAK
jgi:hypothetical protein